MVRFGDLEATFGGTVAWVGPATLRTGKAGVLTLKNVSKVPLVVQKVVETRKLEESSLLLETGSNWSLIEETLGNPTLHTIGPGKTWTAKGQSWVQSRAFKPDWKWEKRKIVTYLGEEVDPWAEPMEDPGNTAATDPLDLVDSDPATNPASSEELVAADLGPYSDFTDPEDTERAGGSGDRGMTILLLLIAVLIGAGGGFALRGRMIRSALGLR